MYGVVGVVSSTHNNTDRLQTEISMTSTEMAGGSPPAHIDICEGPDRLQTEISVTSTEMARWKPSG